MSKKVGSNTKAGTHPDPPKRPSSGYIRFCNDTREPFLKKNPDIKGKEVMRALGEEWTKLSEAGKKKYNDSFEKDKKKYEEELKAYEEKYGKVEKNTKKKEDKPAGEKRGRKTEKSSEPKKKMASKSKGKTK